MRIYVPGHLFIVRFSSSNTVSKTKSIFSVVRANDFVFAHDPPSYDGKDELN